MSKVLFIYYRNKSVPSQVKGQIKNIEKSILPDNLVPNRKDLVIDKGVISCIFNPVALKQREANSLCLGVVGEENWWQLNKSKKVLEGSYAIFRDDQQSIELQTDTVASRSIWYYKDDEKLIASNSQLAIIYFLGDFEFNEKVIPWMLSSGNLGPYLSWDSRIQLLKPQTILSVNKEKWTFDVYTEPILFYNNPDSLGYEDNLKKLSNAIDVSVKHLPLNNNLLLPLSGGYDSRGILLALEKNNKKLPTITWGSKKAIKQKQNDAYIAKQLAEYYELKHTYVHTNNPDLDAKTVIDRFIINSEGRTDNVAGYMDGFKIWNDIFESGYTAIVRGDEAFGEPPVYTEQQVRNTVGLRLANDFNILTKLGFKQSLPEEFLRYENESISEWRDRLYQTYTTPIFYSALNEAKSGYVEIINPLLSNSILKVVRTLPDNLRNEKNLFKYYVENITAPIPFASKGANVNYKTQLKRTDIVDYFISTIRNSNDELINNDFIEDLIVNINTRKKKGVKDRSINRIKRIIPNSIKFYLRGRSTLINQMDNNLLLFRVFIVYKMNQQIKETLKKIS